MASEPSPYRVVEFVFRPGQCDENIGIQEERRHLDLILKQLFDLFCGNFWRVYWQHDSVKTLNHASLNRRLQASAYELGGGLS